MFEKETKFINDFNLNRAGRSGQTSTYAELVEAGPHPAILKYISAEIDLLIGEDRERMQQDSNFDYSGPEIGRYFDMIASEIKRSRRFSLDYLGSLILRASAFNVSFVTRPVWSLLEHIFADSDSVDSAVLNDLLGYTYYYDYLATFLQKYVQKKKIVAFSRQELTEILEKADREIARAYTENVISQALGAMRDLFNMGSVNSEKIPLSAVEMFLREKELDEYTLKLRSSSQLKGVQNAQMKDVKRILFSAAETISGNFIDRLIEKDKTPEAPLQETTPAVSATADVQSDAKPAEQEDNIQTVNIPDENIPEADIQEEKLPEKNLSAEQSDVLNEEKLPEETPQEQEVSVTAEAETAENETAENEKAENETAEAEAEEPETEEESEVLFDLPDVVEMELEDFEETEFEPVEDVPAEPAEEKPRTEEPVTEEEPVKEEPDTVEITGAGRQHEHSEANPVEVIPSEIIPVEGFTPESMAPEGIAPEDIAPETIDSEITASEPIDSENTGSENLAAEDESGDNRTAETTETVKSAEEQNEEAYKQGAGIEQTEKQAAEKQAAEKEQTADEEILFELTAEEDFQGKDIVDYFSEKDINRILYGIFRGNAEEFAQNLAKLSRCSDKNDAEELLMAILKVYSVKPSAKEAQRMAEIIGRFFEDRL